MSFQGFVQEIEAKGWQIHGMEVYRDDKLTEQYGDTCGARYPIYSATKTVTSIAVGMAVDEGKFDIQRSVLDYMPERFKQEMNAEQTAAFRKITIRDLMTMSVMGYPFRPETDCWMREALTCPVKKIDGFEYSNFTAYLTGAAVTEAIGEDLYAYLNRKLFQPLGITEPVYGRCPDGYFYGASKMELTVHELSQIGSMMYHGGVYEGKRILSEEYVKAATSLQKMNREGGYGYFIWLYRDGFSINGKWGQKCYCLPKEGMMITILANLENGSGAVRESMERNILGV